MYEVTTDHRSQVQIDALPTEAREPFAEACRVLELVPWNGDSLNSDNPDAPVRTLAFGATRRGLLTYLVLEELRRVDVLDVLWLD